MEDYPSNETKAALKRGETLMIAEINRVFDPAVVELAAQAGFGCTWIDMEHSHLDFSALAAMVLAAPAQSSVISFRCWRSMTSGVTSWSRSTRAIGSRAGF